MLNEVKHDIQLMDFRYTVLVRNRWYVAIGGMPTRPAYTEIGFQQHYSIDEWFTKFGYAVLTFFVLVPIHECIHGLVYSVVGAKDIRLPVWTRDPSLRSG
jgi:hypothetical protein